MSEERTDGTKNVLVLLLIWAAAIIINPFVKLKDWLKGERE